MDIAQTRTIGLGQILINYNWKSILNVQIEKAGNSIFWIPLIGEWDWCRNEWTLQRVQYFWFVTGWQKIAVVPMVGFHLANTLYFSG